MDDHVIEYTILGVKLENSEIVITVFLCLKY